jgi:hypothetical protein
MAEKLHKHIRHLPSAGGTDNPPIGKKGNVRGSTSSSSGPHQAHLPSTYAGSKGVGASQSKATGIGGGGTGGPKFGFLPSSYETGKK